MSFQKNAIKKVEYDFHDLNEEASKGLVIRFGIHKGRTFGYIVEKHPSYAHWLLQQEFFSDDAVLLKTGKKVVRAPIYLF